MNRRELLGALGLGATGAAGLVGSSADGAGEATATTTGTTTDGTTTGGTPSEGDDFGGIDSSADRPFAALTVGTRAGVRNPENNRPHLVRVWNDSERDRALRLVLRRGDDGTPPVDRRVGFPANGYLTLRPLEPANYALTVAPVGGEATTATDAAAVTTGRDGTATDTDSVDATGETVRIPRTLFDCNDSRTDVRVAADGAVESTTSATEVGCPPEVTDRTFTAFRGNCGATDDAAVSFGDGSVAVEGSIRAPNPCYGARLADVAVTAGDELRVTVAATEPEAGFCAQCVATVEYRAEVAFRDRVPGTVTVVHRGDDATRTVATVSRGGTTPTATGGSGGEATGAETTGAASDGAGATRTATTDAVNSE